MNRLEDRLPAFSRRGDGDVHALSRACATRNTCSRLAPYVTAGDGGLDTTLAVLRALDEAGAACVELGLPFSDPIADGPILQAAAQRGLAAGATLEGALGVIRELRAGGSELPIALFSYANPLLRRGWSAAARLLAEAGGDALLVPDLPVEEGREMRAAALEHGLCPIFFAAPTSSDARIRAAAQASRGFLYAIGRTGVTGCDTVLDENAIAFLARVRRLSPLPVAVGFGLSTPAQMRALAPHADLAVVGSALVARVRAAFAERNDPADAARAAFSYARSLIEALAPP